jgi:uncharacterized protein
MLKRISIFCCGVFMLLTAQGLVAQQPAAAAQQPLSAEKRALIKEFLEVIDTKKNVMALFNAMIEEQEKQMPGIVWASISALASVQQLTEKQRLDLKRDLTKDSTRMSHRLRELFMEKINLGELIERISYVVYDKYFTESELKDIIAFYRSSTGQKTISVMPNLVAESMAQTAEAIKPKLVEVITEFTTEESERVSKNLEEQKPKASPRPTQRRNRKP